MTGYNNEVSKLVINTEIFISSAYILFKDSRELFAIPLFRIVTSCKYNDSVYKSLIRFFSLAFCSENTINWIVMDWWSDILHNRRTIFNFKIKKQQQLF